MLAKGHDFRNVTLVGVLDADNALYSHDFRAPERLFSNLMQVAGRAGRGGARSDRAEVLIQTRAPDHPLFASLVAHDFDRFAISQLAEARGGWTAAVFVPGGCFARKHRPTPRAIACLAQARTIGGVDSLHAGDRSESHPLRPRPDGSRARVAHVERAQLLIEGRERPPLHVFLDAWLDALRKARLRTRWYLEVDPLDI